MKVTDWITHFLRTQGVGQVFELSGGMITHLLDSLNRDGQIRIVSTHHEQAAAFAADAVGRLSGIPGIALATSGPGALNLLTGVGGSYFDSSPTVFLTGQVNRSERKGDRAIRQLGFQETDIVAVATPLVKGAWQAETPEAVPELMRRAFALAMDGRPGPVLIDLPMDVQRAEIEAPPPFKATTAASLDGAGEVDVLERLAAASRPLILAGGGIRSARAIAEFRAFAEALGVPTVHSLMAVDVLPAGHPLRVGMIGTYGNRWANLALSECDLLLVLGSRLDVRQTGSQTTEFTANRTIVHVDCDEPEINNRLSGCIPVLAHLKPFLAAIAGRAAGRSPLDLRQWLTHIRALAKASPDWAEQPAQVGINPNRLMHALSTLAAAAGAFAVDVGQHQMWAAQSLDLGPDQAFLTSGGMGAMGFALPAAIGAAFALAPRPVVAIAGDGGFQINIQELETVARNSLPLKMVVMNNHGHGMVRQFQESYFEGRLQSTVWGYSAPDFAKVAGGYGIDSRTLELPGDVAECLNWLWADPNRPALLQVIISGEAKAYPKVAFGAPISVMEP